MSSVKGNANKLDDYFQIPNPGLGAYLARAERGTMMDDPITAPFAGDTKMDIVLDQWNEVLESVQKDWPTLYKFELDMRSKVGPLSCMQPLANRISDLNEYYDDVLLASSPINASAIKAVLREWSNIRGLTLRSLTRTVENMRLSTNSGAPYFNSHRREVIGDTFPAYITTDADRVIQWLRKDSWDACAVIGWRGQEGGPNKTDVKQRVVWMFPFAVNACELRAYQPLISAAQNFSLVPAWVSMEAVDINITRMFDSKDPKDIVLCTDFSGFDQHFNSDMANAAKTILSGLFKGSIDVASWLENVFPVKYVIPMCYGEDSIRTGRHGMGSGSGGTNADETLTHRALQYEAAIHAKSRLNTYSQCLGDDGVLTFHRLDPEQVILSYSDHGQVMNITKQNISTSDAIYLRRWHHINYRVKGICAGVYSTFRALGRLRYMERYIKPPLWNEKTVALRQLSIIENVKYHPLADQFADFCIKRDERRLGLDIPGFFDNIDKYVAETIKEIPDFLGYVRSQQAMGSIRDWWIVQYVLSKS